ncbi:hypothetical protein T492DRAFT_837557 [Pavlovales sp. CCMP2436]|nr:hypothetical protein T492DRAFT_837557 [Pavlovales sp. CCMP2436]
MTRATKPLKMMSQKELRSYKLDYYNRNKDRVQKARITTSLTNSGKRSVKTSTLEKYGIKADKDSNIVLPKRQNVVLDSAIESTGATNVFNIILKPPVPIEQYKSSNSDLNGKQLTDFALTVMPTLGPKPIGNKEAIFYSKLPMDLIKIYDIKYDPFLDLTGMVSNTDKLIETIKKYAPWKTYSTKLRNLGRNLKLLKIWQPMAVAIPPFEKTYNYLDSVYRRWNGMAKVRNAQINKSNTYFTWDAIRDAVILKFGNESFESLMVQLYDEIVGRNDMALMMAYNVGELTDEKNYLLLDRAKKSSKVILNK